MYKLQSSKYFKKRYEKLIVNNQVLQKRLDKALKQLSLDPWYSGLKTHKVDLPDWGEVYSSWATGDIRIIWREVDGELILILLDIGGHSGGSKVYK